MDYAKRENTPRWQSWPLMMFLMLFSFLYLIWAFPLWLVIGIVFDPFKWMASPLARLGAFLTMLAAPVIAVDLYVVDLAFLPF